MCKKSNSANQKDNSRARWNRRSWAAFPASSFPGLKKFPQPNLMLQATYALAILSRWTLWPGLRPINEVGKTKRRTP